MVSQGRIPKIRSKKDRTRKFCDFFKVRTPKIRSTKYLTPNNQVLRFAPPAKLLDLAILYWQGHFLTNPAKFKTPQLKN